ncbi:hypothetical protein [Hyalangium rubrum]|uniref:Outer membrane protein beta-barrel domain-containing protein n=1 Tax=Hyalangium rubrum TaxID=3103134 RepID=A0ABU5H8B8_9BACT|nr:hypothetical protein [Hyalangium sp. s54d21]MDY7229387.1 hypothetical protein [Hyalangium sp. s54d21]
MHARLLPFLLGALALSTPALAQDEDEDAPLAYPDEEEEEDAPRKLPRRSSDPTADFDRMADEEEAEGDFERMYGSDDPNKGLAGELILGTMLLDSSRGRFADPAFGLGLRFTWEFGRILDAEPLREALWLDVRWTMAGRSEGTELVVGSTRIHYFAVAPAYEFTFGPEKTYGIFGQLGAGMAYQSTSITVNEEATPIKGTKPLIQYGVGFRGRPRLSERMALTFRVELMRFRRGYMDDTFVGASAGTAF